MTYDGCLMNFCKSLQLIFSKFIWLFKGSDFADSNNIVLIIFTLFCRITLVGASTCHEASPTLMLISLEYEGLEVQDSSDLE